MDLYNYTSFKINKLITRQYSTSFSLGIMVFSKEYKNPIYAIYGFVRLADEIVDTFHGHDKVFLLKKYREDTIEAIRTGISTNPVLQAFQYVVNKYKIDLKLIDAFLNSMEMDLNNSSYGRNNYDDYIFGSAEAVGLMCLYVFVKGDKDFYNQLVKPARALGSAFQKVNFLRDIQSDIEQRGRIYLPDIHNSSSIDNDSKKKLEAEVEEEFKLALLGIAKLPGGVKLGVYSAYLYYYVLLHKIKKLDVNELLKRRVRIPNFQKIFLFLKSYYTIRVRKLNFE